MSGLVDGRIGIYTSLKKVYADVSDHNVTITDKMGLLEPIIDDPYNSTKAFTLVHNMYPLSINRNGEIVVYNNQPKDFPYVTSLFYTANVSQIKYDSEIYKPLTPYMYYRTTVQIGKPTNVEILYSYLNRYPIVIAKVPSSKVLYANPEINIDTVTRNILLPVDYNMLFYLESQWSRLAGSDDSMRVFVPNRNGNDVEYPIIINSDSSWSCNLVFFQRGNINAVNLVAATDLDIRIIPLNQPMSFFAGGGLLGLGRHKPEEDSRYYLFSWYKIMRTKRSASVPPRADDYLRYYYYYQYII